MVPIARTFVTISRAYGGSPSQHVTLFSSSCSQLVDQEWMLSKALGDLAEQIIRSAFRLLYTNLARQASSPVEQLVFVRGLQ